MRSQISESAEKEQEGMDNSLKPSRVVRRMHKSLFSVLSLMTCCALTAQNKNVASYSEHCSGSRRLG
jgi:hypothetical protein